ncbi:hypothetical protein, conserved [Plasmodium gonderi]|uniref:Uncharacterized protein n=1 Tax=Plasmodium gonderi TaxID=77519 RepID=A0A1Y1JHC3_PLAGO|nr:hypothetical protein, conserved [Plasmodium gonderi]GAW81048.1 hypothetical protein, conserved [Plasmodium gonderi]
MWNLINYNYTEGNSSGQGKENGNDNDNPNGEKENDEKNNEQKSNDENQNESQQEKKLGSKHIVRVIDEDGNNIVDKTLGDDINEIEDDSADKKKKKKNKKTKKHLTSENRDKSPFLSDLSSYADYYTSDDERKKKEFLVTNEDDSFDHQVYEAPSRVKEYNVFLNTGEDNENVATVDEADYDNPNGDNSARNNLDVDNLTKNNPDGGQSSENQILRQEYTSNVANEWFFGKIKEMLEPSINQESISEIITNKYNSFNEGNSGIFHLLENLLIRTSTQEKLELNKKQKSTYLYNHYNSMDSSVNDSYNFVNYSIYCINKELAANVELEATKMIKIYNYALNKFKKDINFKDDIYADLENEADEVSTLIINEKNNQKKRIPKIDFLILININSDNYNDIIESHNVQTPKLKLEDIFKISVN